MQGESWAGTPKDHGDVQGESWVGTQRARELWIRVQAADAALECDPCFIKAYVRKAKALYAMNKFDEASQVFASVDARWQIHSCSHRAQHHE